MQLNGREIKNLAKTAQFLASEKKRGTIKNAHQDGREGNWNQSENHLREIERSRREDDY